MFRAFRLKDATFAIFSFIGLITLFYSFSSILENVLFMLSGWIGKLFLVCTAIAAACVLFLIRETNRYRYALLELTFAIVSSWYSVTTLTNDSSQWPVFVGALYLIVRGLDNLKEGYNRRLISWRFDGMNGKPEERDEFLKAIFHGVRFNGRAAILAAPKMGISRRNMFDKLTSSMINFALKQAKETDYNEVQTNLYVEAHRKAYESLAEEFAFDLPQWSLD